MENPNTTPSAAQQAENKGSERMFSQEELRAYPQINKSDIIVPKAGDNNDREEKLSIVDHIR